LPQDHILDVLKDYVLFDACEVMAVDLLQIL
jgi:hypothetical protein